MCRISIFVKVILDQWGLVGSSAVLYKVHTRWDRVFHCFHISFDPAGWLFIPCPQARPWLITMSIAIVITLWESLRKCKIVTFVVNGKTPHKCMYKNQIDDQIHQPKTQDTDRPHLQKIWAHLFNCATSTSVI